MADSLFSRKCLDILHAGSVKEFSKQLVQFSQSVGFSTVSAVVVTDHSPTLTEFQTVSNSPADYLPDFENLELGLIDPVSQHCKRSSLPIAWDRTNYTSPEQSELWERQAVFGYRSGFAFAVHPGKGRHFMLGVDWEHDRCARVPYYKHIFQDILEFGLHAQAAAFDLCLPARANTTFPSQPAPSELEALRWSMDGMTSWEVAHAMSLSERHATLLMQRAMRKLGCATKYEAILLAIRLGLIEAP